MHATKYHRSILWVGEKTPTVIRLNQLFHKVGYKVQLIEMADEALAFLKTSADAQQHVRVIIIDCTIGDRSGLEFLDQAKSFYSDALYILFASQNEISSKRENFLTLDHCSYLFLSKTLDEQALLYTVDQTFTHYELIEQNQHLHDELQCANEALRLLSVELELRVKQKIEERIQAINYDALTGLPNRNLTQDRLKFSIQYAKRTKRSVMVMCIGLDNFKLINEGIGYKVGDHLLRVIGHRLSTHLRSCDSIGRLEGDQFCLILNDVYEHEQPDKLAQRILELLAIPFGFENHDIFLTTSIGISLFPADARQAKRLLTNAESAMRQGKAEGKNIYRFYSKRLNHAASKRLSMTAELKHAVEANEFELYYQPRINTHSARIVGVEALLRWKHPQRGIIPPLNFLPVLEETGLIEPIGEWVIKEACNTLLDWEDCGLSAINMAVNLSAKQFRNDNFFRRVSNIIEKSGINLGVSHLEFEITESLLMENVDMAKRVLQQFSDLGIKLAIDDFGTGYSSLSYLIQFPLHYLKVDRSFISGIVDSAESRAIVHAIVNLASSLKLTVIAEGIENVDQLRAMQELDCNEFQGFFFSEPLTQSEMVKLLKADKRLSQTSLSSIERQDTLH